MPRLLQISRSCQPRHKFAEEELRQRVFVIQDRTRELRGRALDAVVALIDDIEKRKGRPDAELARARDAAKQGTSAPATSAKSGAAPATKHDAAGPSH